MERSTKAFGAYHWDTFEPVGDDTFLVAEADTLAEAENMVQNLYGERIKANGADRVDIVEEARGQVVRSYNIG